MTVLHINALKACALFASTELTRSYLNGVFVTVSARTVTYAAANGHVLLAHAVALEKNEPDYDLQGSWIIPSETIKALKLGKLRSNATYAAAVTLSRLSATHFRLAGMASDIVFQPIDGTFPDWQRVIPATVDGEPSHFDGAYMALFEKARDELSISMPAIHHNGVAPCPVTFGTQDSTTIGIIMPRRVSHDTPWSGMPAIFNHPVPVDTETPAEMLQAAE